MEFQTQTVKSTDLRAPDRKAVDFSKYLLDRFEANPNVKVVDKLEADQKIGCKDDKGALKKAVVSLPTYLDWGKGINVAEIENANNKPDRFKAVKEHAALIQALLDAGVEITLIRPSQERLEGVYTRDIAIVIDRKCIQANMVAEPRKAEEKTIGGGIKPPKEVELEGGNVVPDGDRVFVGIGDRGNLESALWLQEIIGTTSEVVPLMLRPGVLHLDCAFSPIAKPNGIKGGALVFTEAFADENNLELIRKIYGRTFSIGKEEYKKLGVNTFALDPETRIVNPGCKTVCGILESELHQKVIKIGLDEIVKGEGYARCSIMPLLRE